MSRCKACNRVMHYADYSPLEEGGEEESICMSCKQEIIKNTPWEATIEYEDGKPTIVDIQLPPMDLGFTVEELEEAYFEDIFKDYKNGVE